MKNRVVQHQFYPKVSLKPTLIAMTDISKDQRNVLDKIVLEGRLYKLFLNNIKTEYDIDYWVNGFIGAFDSKDRIIVENFKYFWRESDKEKSEAPRYGVCAGLKQVQWLIEQERISRVACGVDLDGWVALKRLTSFQYLEQPKDGDTPNVPTTGNMEKRALDKVILYV